MRCEFERIEAGRVKCRLCGTEVSSNNPPDRVHAKCKSTKVNPHDSMGESLSLKALADVMKSKCDCDREERYTWIARKLEKWPKPESLDNGQWVVGVTTAPRKFGTIMPCLNALRINGWDPIVFAEPGTKIAGWEGLDWRENKTRLGAFHNWLHTARSLLSDTDAKLFMIVQDDTVIVPGSREFLDRRLTEYWPGGGTAGCVSLYTPSHYAKGRNVGCFRQDVSGGIWGACAMIFNRRSLEIIIDHPITKRWRGAGSEEIKARRLPHEIANVDTVIGKVLNAERKGVFYYHPSLAQHVAPYSTLKHGADRGRRGASVVVSDFDVFTDPKKAAPYQDDPIEFVVPKGDKIRIGFYWGAMNVGGTERWLESLATRLDPEKFEIVGVAVQPSSEKTHKLTIPFRVTESLRSVAGSSDILIVWGVRELETARKYFTGPLVMMSHGVTSYTSKRVLELAPFASHYAAVSKLAATAFPRKMQSIVKVIPNGIPPMEIVDRKIARHNLGIEDDRLLIGYIGRFHQEKGVVSVAMAASAIPESNVVFHGWPKKGLDIRPRFDRLVESLVGGRVIWRNPDHQVGETLGALDVLMLPSQSEGFGLVVAEAWQAGVPVVTTNTGIASEHPDAVVYLPEVAPSADVLRSCVHEAVNSRDRLIERGKQLIRDEYHIDKMVTQWEEYLIGIYGTARNRFSGAV